MNGTNVLYPHKQKHNYTQNNTKYIKKRAAHTASQHEVPQYHHQVPHHPAMAFL